jgi:hypothetical protein
MKSVNYRVGEHFILHEIYDRYADITYYANIGGKVKVRQVIELL